MSPRRRTVFAALALLVAGCATTATGGELFDQQCIACHAADGTGPGGSLGSGSTAVTASDIELATVIRRGRNAMPGFPRLSDAQIETLVAHIRTLQSEG